MHPGRERNLPVPPALRRADRSAPIIPHHRQQAILEVDVCPFEREQLSEAQPRFPRHQHCRVPFRLEADLATSASSSSNVKKSNFWGGTFSVLILGIRSSTSISTAYRKILLSTFKTLLIRFADLFASKSLPSGLRRPYR